jgi:protein-disulfide isomerase
VTPTLGEIVKNYPGKVRWVFRHYPLSSTPGAGSFLTHEASVCAQEQGKFWEFHDAVFDLPAAPQPSDLDSIVKGIGLDETQYQECLKSGRHQGFLKEESSEGSQRGVQGTPTLFLNDKIIAGAYPYEHFVKVIEEILNPGRAPQAAPTPASPPRPPAPKEPVRFDDLEKRPSLGPDNAPVTLVEFSDFHCPFCKKVGPTLERLMENYPKKIRRVWRHYPLALHTGAERTHQASECANEQEKFWEYHKKLFETQGGPRDDAALVKLAGEVKLDKKKFEKCLSSGKYKVLIQEEIAKGNEAGVRGTPAVFVNGRLVSGAQPYENFDQIVKQELAKD